MPTLKQITCSIQLGPTDTKLKEYGHRFTDGGVEAFVAVPDTDIPFNVRVTSSGYIAPGLAAYVFMDGQYQCNRNRQRLQLPAPDTSARDYEVDFTLRQKEDKSADGTFVAREWTFAELKTANADKSPDTNPAFAKNVGTIEVVILRCRGDTPYDPAETVIDGGDETGIAAITRAPPVANSALAANARSSAKPASKARSKAPTKEPSAAVDDGMGGMSGLFDGAGDDPDHGRRMPGYYDDRSPWPHYRQDLRDANRYAPRPFTVHGGYGNRNAGDQRERPYDTRPRTANDQYPSHGTPGAGYDFQQRRRHAPGSVLQSPMQRQDTRPYQPAYTPRAPPSSLAPRMSAPEGFAFILDVCREIDNLYRLSFSERRKCAELSQEARRWEDDPEMHLTAMKALRLKEQEIENVDDELKVMYQSIYARMRRMDPRAWQTTRDFLILEARLFSPEDPQMQQWPDPRLQQHLRSPEFGATQTSGAIDDRTGPSPRSKDGWEEQGQGETSGRLHQGQLRKQSGAQGGGFSAGKPAGDGWGASPQQGDGGWAQDAVDEQVNDGNHGGALDGNGIADKGGEWRAWSGSNKGEDTNWNNDDKNSESKKDGNDDWGGTGDAQPDNNVDKWDANDNNDDSKQDDSWERQNEQSNQEEVWPNNNDGAGSQKSGSKTDDGRSGGGNAKVDSKNKGGKKTQAVAGWGSKSSAKAQGSGGDWEEVGANEAQARSRASSRRPANSTTSVALEPVIKPYWADWNKPQQDMTRPRVQPRDPYEYPRAATVLAPAGRARDVSHGVQAGRGANYAHKTFRPEYLDTMDKPYAIFTFKYRSQAALEQILNRKIDTRETKRAVDEAEKEILMRLPKDELVKEMLKMRLNPPRSGSKPASAAKAPSNTGWDGKAPSRANDWGGDQQRDDIEPGDSVSAVSAKQSNRGGWGADDKDATSWRSQAKYGGGWKAASDNNGGGAWANDDNKSKSKQKGDKKSNAEKPKTKVSGWGAAPAAGGHDAWGGPAAGGGDWQADDVGEDKAGSNSEAHFSANDPGLQNTGGRKASDNCPAVVW